MSDPNWPDDPDFQFTFDEPEPGPWPSPMEQFEDLGSSFNPIERDPYEETASRVSGFIEFYKEHGFDKWPPDSPRTDLSTPTEDPLKPGGARPVDAPSPLPKEGGGIPWREPYWGGFKPRMGRTGGRSHPEGIWCFDREEYVQREDCEQCGLWDNEAMECGYFKRWKENNQPEGECE